MLTSKDFRMWESCRTMLLVGEFSRDLPFPPFLHSGAGPYSSRFTIIVPRNLGIKNRIGVSTSDTCTEVEDPSASSLVCRRFAVDPYDWFMMNGAVGSMRVRLGRFDVDSVCSQRTIADVRCPTAPRRTARCEMDLQQTGQSSLTVYLYPLNQTHASIPAGHCPDTLQTSFSKGKTGSRYLVFTEVGVGTLCVAVEPYLDFYREPVRQVTSDEHTMVRLLASHLDEPGSVPAAFAPRLLHVGIVPDDAAGRRVFSKISRFPHPLIPALLHTHVASPSSALSPRCKEPPNSLHALIFTSVFQRLLTYSPAGSSADRESFVARSSQSDTRRPVRRASRRLSKNGHAHIESTDTPFHLCVLIYVVLGTTKQANTLSADIDGKQDGRLQQTTINKMAACDIKQDCPIQQTRCGRRRRSTREQAEADKMAAGILTHKMAAGVLTHYMAAAVASSKMAAGLKGVEVPSGGSLKIQDVFRERRRGPVGSCSPLDVGCVQPVIPWHRICAGATPGKLTPRRAPRRAACREDVDDHVALITRSIPVASQPSGEAATVAARRSLADRVGATVTERLACSPLSKAVRVQSPAGSIRIFLCRNRAGQCRWSAGFLGDLPFPPLFHSGATPYSPQSPSSALKTSMLRAVQISSLNPLTRRAVGVRGIRRCYASIPVVQPFKRAAAPGQSGHTVGSRAGHVRQFPHFRFIQRAIADPLPTREVTATAAHLCGRKRRQWLQLPRPSGLSEDEAARRRLQIVSPSLFTNLSTSGRPGHARLPPMRTGFNPLPGQRIFASGYRAGRCRRSAGFLGDPPPPPSSLRRRYKLTIITHIGSQDLAANWVRVPAGSPGVFALGDVRDVAVDGRRVFSGYFRFPVVFALRRGSIFTFTSVKTWLLSAN
ncbi:hypothetical protein PR048_017635 [Dryococelus australis]|uniref:Uncharacterized protein n=1 Tax=Dryococelus australis TaxID=614101 RepID=A0ABQ9HA25_9NEOP|nr:hypothetical protein PR048_017635 [Dryococelus australis]